MNLILIASIVMIVTPVAEDRSIPRFSLGMVLAASAGLRLSNYQGLEIPIRAWCSAAVCLAVEQYIGLHYHGIDLTRLLVFASVLQILTTGWLVLPAVNSHGLIRFGGLAVILGSASLLIDHLFFQSLNRAAASLTAGSIGLISFPAALIIRSIAVEQPDRTLPTLAQFRSC